MVTAEHEVPLRILQSRPETALDLLEIAGFERPRATAATPGSEVSSNVAIRPLNCDSVFSVVGPF
ncbi:hypothetical protein [Salininema proteolyticum]|uniref:Uncharacterized protein n=1 Tax=Salininema proteolyticum TaxID=1607685 RepID=A0ABV8TX03_9ACTN